MPAGCGSMRIHRFAACAVPRGVGDDLLHAAQRARAPARVRRSEASPACRGESSAGRLRRSARCTACARSTRPVSRIWLTTSRTSVRRSLRDGVRLADVLCRLARGQPRRHVELQAERGQVMAERVVQVAGDAQPLGDAAVLGQQRTGRVQLLHSRATGFRGRHVRWWPATLRAIANAWNPAYTPVSATVSDQLSNCRMTKAMPSVWAATQSQAPRASNVTAASAATITSRALAVPLTPTYIIPRPVNAWIVIMPMRRGREIEPDRRQSTSAAPKTTNIAVHAAARAGGRSPAASRLIVGTPTTSQVANAAQLSHRLGAHAPIVCAASGRRRVPEVMDRDDDFRQMCTRSPPGTIAT